MESYLNYSLLLATLPTHSLSHTHTLSLSLSHSQVAKVESYLNYSLLLDAISPKEKN